MWLYILKTMCGCHKVLWITLWQFLLQNFMREVVTQCIPGTMTSLIYVSKLDIKYKVLQYLYCRNLRPYVVVSEWSEYATQGKLGYWIRSNPVLCFDVNHDYLKIMYALIQYISWLVYWSSLFINIVIISQNAKTTLTFWQAQYPILNELLILISIITIKHNYFVQTKVLFCICHLHMYMWPNFGKWIQITHLYFVIFHTTAWAALCASRYFLL